MRCQRCNSYLMDPEDARDHSCVTVGDACARVDANRSALASQARTIRRLRALADGYRARATRNGLAASDNCEVCHDMGASVGCEEERARIVAYLRREAGIQGMYQDEEAYLRAADAIERGEL